METKQDLRLYKQKMYGYYCNKARSINIKPICYTLFTLEDLKEIKKLYRAEKRETE